MIFEVLVLDGRDGVVENLWALLVGHQDAALQGKATDHLPVICINFGDHVGPICFQCANFGQVARVNEEQSAPSAERDRAQQQERDGNAVNQFPAAKSKSDRRKT